MGQQRVLIMTLLLASNYVACNANQSDPSMYLKSHQQHKRYQNSEPSDDNTLEGKVGDDADIFEDLEPSIYDNLVRLIREMQKGRERVSIRYRPNLGKRSELFQ